MKTIRRAALCMGIILAVEGNIIAQSSAPENMQIPTTLSIINNIDFGIIEVRHKGISSVVIPPIDNERSVVCTNSSHVPAHFTVSGIPGYIFGITLPDIDTFTDKNSMIIISDFTSTPSGTGMLNVSGTRMIKVGATLFIHPARKPDHYSTATDMPVTVNYN